MKKTAKLLLSSLLTVAICISMIGGATFALFTSEDSVDITVSSGAVNIKSALSISSAYSAEWSTSLGDYERKDIDPVGDVYTFANKGTLSLGDGASVEAVNITPGDGFVLAVEIRNFSTVATKYRVEMSTADSGLLGGLEIKYSKDGAELEAKGNKIKYTEWQNVSAATDVTAGDVVGTISIEVSMPTSTGNEYNGDGLSCALKVSVFAVQQNGNVSDPVDYAIKADEAAGKTAEDVLKEAFAAVQPGETIRLDSDIDIVDSQGYNKDLRIVQEDVTIDLNDHTLKMQPNMGNMLFGYAHSRPFDLDSGDDPADVVLQNGTILAEGLTTAAIRIEASSTIEFHNIHFKTNAGGKIGQAVQIYPTGTPHKSDCSYCESRDNFDTQVSCLFEDCIFDDAFVGMSVSSSMKFVNSDIQFKRCKFNFTATEKLIQISMTSSSLTVEDCEFSVDMAAGGDFCMISLENYTEDTIVDITRCTLNYSNYSGSGFSSIIGCGTYGSATVNYSDFTVVGEGSARKAMPLFRESIAVKVDFNPGEGNSYTYNSGVATFDIG